MTDWQKRLIEERDALANKAGKLDNYDFSHLDDVDKCLLELQLGIMESYLSVLNMRILRF